MGKRQTYLPGDLDENILALYGLGTSYRDIQAHVLQMYGTSIIEVTVTRVSDPDHSNHPCLAGTGIRAGVSHNLDGCVVFQAAQRRESNYEGGLQRTGAEY